MKTLLLSCLASLIKKSVHLACW